MPSINFIVPTAGIPQPRPKARRIGPGIQIYTPQNAAIRLYKAKIIESFMQVVGLDFKPLEGAIELSIDFVFERSQSRMKDTYHISRPDVDNLTKGVMDALNDVAWIDDSQVQELHVAKSWADTELGGKSGRKLISKASDIRVRIEYE